MIENDLEFLYKKFNNDINIISSYSTRFSVSFENSNKSLYMDVDKILINLEEKLNALNYDSTITQRIQCADFDIIREISEKGITLSEDEKSSLYALLGYFSMKKDKEKEPLIHRIMIYTHLYTMFDAFLLDIIMVVLKYYTNCLKTSEKVLNYEEILNCKNKEEIIELIIDKELTKFGHESIFDKIYFFISRGIKFDEMEVDLYSLIEFNRKRNIIIHNKGIVNKIFFQPVKEYQKKFNQYSKAYINLINKLKTNFSEDEKIEITESHINVTMLRISTFSEYLFQQINLKFGKNNE